MTYKIAAYLRLSWADEDLDQSEKSESNSITNQRSLIKYYLNTQQEFSEGPHADYEYFEYVDDGISGTTVEHRPSFLRLISDSKSHKIDCIIVKDFSRFSRESLVLGDYVEQILPMIGIRFISINDHYDSTRTAMSGSTSALTVSMKALVNEYYVKDNVRKRTAAIQARMATGLPMGTAPYGYRRVNTRNYEIDPITSQAVRRIYSLALEGKSISQIGRILTDEGYPTPNDYNLAHPEEKHSHRPPTSVHRWSDDSIRLILHNPVYTGTLTTGRTKNSPHQKKKRIPTAPEEQYVTINAHPAIISAEEYAAVQKMYEKPSSPPRQMCSSVPLSLRNPYQAILKGHLRCGYCGRVLVIYKNGSSCKCPNSYEHSNSSYQATAYRTEHLLEFLYLRIQELIDKIIKTERECQTTYRADRKRISDLNLKQGLLEKELSELSSQKELHYERLIDGTYTITQYKMHNQAVHNQSEKARQELETLQGKIQKLREYQVPIELQILAEHSILYSCAPEISGEMVDEYIKEVIIRGSDPPQIIWNHQDLLTEYGLI